MRPRVLKREKKLYLTYDLPHRVYCSTILSTTAPNGSTVLLYGHDNGLTILWRGGRRAKQTESASRDSDIIDIEIDEDQNTQHEQQIEYEDDEEETDRDGDTPYQNILYSLNIDPDQPVSKIAVVQEHNTSSTRTGSPSSTVAIATNDGVIRLLSIPLEVPLPHTEANVAARVLSNALRLRDTSTYVRTLAAKAVSSPEGKIVIIAGSGRLEVWHLSQQGSWREKNIQYESLPYSGTLVSLSFHPAPRSTEFMAVDKFGFVNDYDLNLQQQGSETMALKWRYTLTSPWEAVEGSRTTRKRILDARFVLGGRFVLALLYDGQWGVWNMTNPQEGKGIEQFEFSGFLDSVAATVTSAHKMKKTPASLLTPMTPNTRKSKSDDLFAIPQARYTEAVATGGISVSRANLVASGIDESVMLWHQSNLYAIPSFENFYKRSTDGVKGAGSLHAPGIASILGVNVFNECITSLSQFKQASTSSGIGQLRTQRDFIASTEHRLLIVQSDAPYGSTQTLRRQAEHRDQRMLDSGELDIGGVDRILDFMTNEDRKVGFAH